MAVTPGPGHNNGPTMEGGAGWRRHAWRRARAALVPTLPVEVVRLRVRRAKELGLPYRTYAGIRAATGHDLIGFLFSSNALRLIHRAELPADRAARLTGIIGAERRALVHRPLAPAQVTGLQGLDAAYPAPLFTDSWSVMAQKVRAATEGRPADRFLIVGDQPLEKDWAEAGRTAGYIAAEAFFAASP